MCGKFHKFTEYTHSLVCTHYDVSFAKNKLQKCLVTQHQGRRRQKCRKLLQIHTVHSLLSALHQCRRRQMCVNFHKFTQYTHFLHVTKSYLSWLWFQLTFNISVEVDKSAENFNKFTQYTHFCLLQKELLVLTDKSIHGMVWTHSYAMVKLQMCSDAPHQFRRRQICGKLTNSHSTLTLCLLQKELLVLTEQSIHGMVSTHYDVLLCK